MTTDTPRDTRITRSPGTRAMKASKPQSANSVLTSTSLKNHLPVPTLKSAKGSSAKTSPSTSSSDSSSGKRGLKGGKATPNREAISQGMKDAPVDAKVSFSDISADTTGAKIESLSAVSFECVEPDEAKHITDDAEPFLWIPELRPKNPSSPDVDVVHSNLAMTWFNVGDFMNTKADMNLDTTGSEKQINLLSEATDPPKALLLESINSYMDELELGVIGRPVYSVNTPLQQDEKCEEGKPLEKTPDVTECVEEKDNCLQYEDGSTLPEKSGGKGQVKLACENFIRHASHGIHAFGGWRDIKFLLPASVLVLLSFLLKFFIDGELDMLPPPT